MNLEVFQSLEEFLYFRHLFQANNQSGTILARKLKKVLDSQLETDLETQEALRELSKFFTENTLRNRRNLRGEIERQSLNNHLEFLNRFEKVKVSLKMTRISSFSNSTSDPKNVIALYFSFPLTTFTTMSD
jgi:hypothetical protein